MNWVRWSFIDDAETIVLIAGLKRAESMNEQLLLPSSC